MVLSKDIEIFNHEYGWTDGFITELRWDENLLDLLVTVNTYEGKNKEGRNLTIRFKYCREVNFDMNKRFDNVSEEERSDCVFSWYTIEKYELIEEDSLITFTIGAFDDSPRWLKIKCDEIWVEGEKN